MITYSKLLWDGLTLSQWYGSAFPRALPFSLTSAAIAGCLQAFAGSHMRREWEHPYPYTAFAFIVGFMIVFRSNLSYGRYWEGRSNLQTMTSKLTDATVQTLAFDLQTMPEEPSDAEVAAYCRFRDTVVHLISLLHAVSLATLRDDYDMGNLVVHDSLLSAPPVNAGGIRELRGAVNADGVVTHTPNHHPSPSKYQAAEKVEHTHRSKAFGRLSFLDFFVLKTGTKHAKNIYDVMRLPVIGGFTQAEGVALGAFVTSEGSFDRNADADRGIHGTLLSNGTYAPAPFERVHSVSAWIHQVILERVREGGLQIAPPILARIQTVLSEAMLGYEHCRKLVDTPFPFPWAQAVTIVLLMFTFSAPFLISGFTTSITSSTLMAFAVVHTYVMLNEVARDVEDPFHYDPNELPLPQMQYRLNERLLAVSKAKRPVAFTDFADLTGPGNTPVPKIGGYNSQALSQASPQASHSNSPAAGVPLPSTPGSASPLRHHLTSVASAPSPASAASNFVRGHSSLAHTPSDVQPYSSMVHVHSQIMDTASRDRWKRKSLSNTSRRSLPFRRSPPPSEAAEEASCTSPKRAGESQSPYQVHVNDHFHTPSSLTVDDSSTTVGDHGVPQGKENGGEAMLVAVAPSDVDEPFNVTLGPSVFEELPDDKHASAALPSR